jgi:hypothetical protein
MPPAIASRLWLNAGVDTGIAMPIAMAITALFLIIAFMELLLYFHLLKTWAGVRAFGHFSPTSVLFDNL